MRNNIKKIKKRRGFIIYLFGILTFIGCNSQNMNIKQNPYAILNVKESTKKYSRAIVLSKSDNAYHFMELRSFLNANNALIKKKYDKNVIEYQLLLIENIISTAVVSKNIKNNKSSYQDSYKSWITLSDTKMKFKEGVLYEGYSFFYIAQFLYYTKRNGWSNETLINKKRWNEILTFVEENVWTKWYERSLKVYNKRYSYFLWTRTHMGSHWAGIAMYIGALSKDNKIKEQCQALVEQFDILLKRNFKTHCQGYIWNRTYDNISGTDANTNKVDLVQDVSHGNHVISYIIAAYEFNNKNWTLVDVKKLAFTFSNFIYDKDLRKFNDNVDGSNDNSSISHGDFVGDGWVKLAKYDKDVKNLMIKLTQTNSINKYNQEIQFKANLLVANDFKFFNL